MNMFVYNKPYITAGSIPTTTPTPQPLSTETMYVETCTGEDIELMCQHQHVIQV